MVDFKGRCGKCRRNTTAINPGLVCASCHLAFHADCHLPPMTIRELKTVAITDPQWVCKKCQKDRKDIPVIMRPKDDLIDLSMRMDMIIEVRELLELAELALDQLQEKHDNLVKLNKFLQHENLILTKRLNRLDEAYKFKVELLDQMTKHKATLKAEEAEKLKYEDKKEPTEKKDLEEKKEEELVTKDFTTFAKYAGLNKSERAAFTMQGHLKKLSKTWFTHLCLFLCVIIYTCVGGLIFHLLEKDKDLSATPHGKEQLITEYSSLLAGDSDKNVTLKKFEGDVRSLLVWEAKLQRGEDELKWGYFASVFFCGTVYTTIGYGHMYPETVFGKITVIIYATIGIPLFLLALADFGTALTRWIKGMWNILLRYNCSKCCKKKLSDSEERPVNKDVNLPVTVALVIELIYLVIGSVLFHFWEGWSFLDSFYFVFESMATIGIKST
ncbi:TWiK family of potassium channels protein 7-like isoform X2 [Cimex lectularius]|uniref:PHD-type domain-containing protein n=1 Tax=Cimex lectularius TaxID=79782 RepID=A0A8I6TBZ9_CIMLE|nr:TWiK family of potassium channels protein 7-like isoform X2 [Cimex lectularius]